MRDGNLYHCHRGRKPNGQYRRHELGTRPPWAEGVRTRQHATIANHSRLHRGRERHREACP